MGGVAGFFDWTRDNALPQWGEVGERMQRGLPGSGGGAAYRLAQGLLISGDPGGLAERPLGTARYAIAYDGELQNAAGLEKVLRAQGYPLTTRTGPELALYAYMEFGEELGGRLEGEYALALWDGLKRQCFLCADPDRGRRMFYVNYEGGAFIFATQPEALFRYPGPTADLRVLEPGEWLAYDREGLRRGKTFPVLSGNLSPFFTRP